MIESLIFFVVFICPILAKIVRFHIIIAILSYYHTTERGGGGGGARKTVWTLSSNIVELKGRKVNLLSK